MAEKLLTNYQKSILSNEGRKATISNECKVSSPTEARADIAQVEIVAFLRVTHTILRGWSEKFPT